MIYGSIGGEGIHTNNLVMGMLSLYGNSPTDVEFTAEELGRLKNRVKLLSHRVQKGILNLRGNRIDRIVVDEGIAGIIRDRLLEQHGKPPELDVIFRMIFLAGNVISEGPNQLLAVNLSLNSNFFGRVMEGPSVEDLARFPERKWAIASKAVYIGNIGDVDAKLSSVSDESEVAANLIEIIEY